MFPSNNQNEFKPKGLPVEPQNPPDKWNFKKKKFPDDVYKNAISNKLGMEISKGVKNGN